MRALWRNGCVALLAASLASPALGADPDPQDLIRRYQHETSELAKRDLALKMIDTGVLKFHSTTRKDVERIFGSDWSMFADDPEDARPYGLVQFAKQFDIPEGNTSQIPYVGWYLAIFFSPKTYVVVDWQLSNHPGK
jgi:hypothetical protein